ncbi:Glucans biosynthesis protein G precursor [compost metagenome]
MKQSNLIRQPDGSLAFLVDFEGPVLAALPEDTAVRSQVSVDDNAELVENNVRYNPVTKGWRLTLRLKVKDPSKAVEMRAALVKDLPPAEPAKAEVAAKPEKAAAKKVAAKTENTDKPAEQPAAAEATPTTEVPAKTEQVLTETWSYQLSADE